MIHLILIIGLFLLAIAVMMVARAVTTPGRSETIEQIGAYGFAGSLPTAVDEGPDLRVRLGDLSGSIGRWLARHITRLRGRDYRSRLVAAGMYTTTTERLLGTQFLCAVGGAFLWIGLAATGGMAMWFFVLGLVGVTVLGWVGPMFIVDSRARKRRDQIERGLPDLIDLLVVTLEAGLSFPQSLRLAAGKIKEPLSSEVRLTLQEQNMGLTIEDSLQNMLGRVDSMSVRVFVQAIVQGQTLGVSIGKILRDLALDMRKRRRQMAEERAQKAPTKILFPLVFLILPALMIIVLGGPVMGLGRALGGSL
jgi:tight adherence protein C